jgi:uncharacterized protein (TIGR02145 family)
MWMRRLARDHEAGGSVVDSRDGETYRTVRIAGRTWLAENLRHRSPGSRCLSDVDEACLRNGRLYRWRDALTACPAGYRLPSETDWRGLESHLGVPADALAASGPRGSHEGTRLRVGGDTGFDAFLAGYLRPDGTPRRAGERAAFWTSSADEAADPAAARAWHRDLSQDPRIYRSPVEVDYWLSVRCVATADPPSSGSRAAR